jgi:hypothetical protein
MAAQPVSPRSPTTYSDNLPPLLPPRNPPENPISAIAQEHLLGASQNATSTLLTLSEIRLTEPPEPSQLVVIRSIAICGVAALTILGALWAAKQITYLP